MGHSNYKNYQREGGGENVLPELAGANFNIFLCADLKIRQPNFVSDKCFVCVSSC